MKRRSYAAGAGVSNRQAVVGLFVRRLHRYISRFLQDRLSALGSRLSAKSASASDSQGPQAESSPVKTAIHPEYHTATVKCACGNSFQTRSTQAEIHTDICNQCHPFFTGKQKLIDTAGRVERFRQKYDRKES
jgi:large subunit ribosomal protein L31